MGTCPYNHMALRFGAKYEMKVSDISANFTNLAIAVNGMFECQTSDGVRSVFCLEC